MFNTIFKYELKYWLKQPSIYLYIIFFLGVSTLAMMGILGAFDAPSTDPNPLKENSALSIYSNINYLTILILFLLPAIIGNSVYRDYKSNMHYILYSYPFTKKDYFFAKFFSSLLVVLVIVAMIGLGIVIGTQMPGVQQVKLAPFSIWPYLQIYLLFIIPNLFLYGAIVFGVVTFSRNVYAGFITVGLLLFIPQLILNIPMHDYALCLLDPFGEYAVKYATQDWTAVQQSENLLPVTKLLIANRLLWLLIAIGIFSWVYKKFSFSQMGKVISLKRVKNDNLLDQTTNENAPTDRQQAIAKTYTLSVANFDFSLKEQLKTMWKLSTIDFYSILKSWPFITILLAGFVVVIFLLLQMNSPFENEILPVTWIILTFPVLFYSLVVKILTFLYTGIVMHRAKTARMNHLIDVTPIANWALLGSKFLAIIKMQFVLQVAVMIAGICIQAGKGYFNFDMGHYILELLVFNMLGYIIWTMAGMLIHSLVKNVYLGLFVLLAGLFGISILPEIGVENPIFLFNSSGMENIIPYTDMNGFGHKLIGFLAYKGYWFIGGVLLLISSYLLWNRGVGRNLKERLSVLKRRYQGKVAFLWLCTFVVFVSVGALFYYENTIKNPAITNESIKETYGNFEKEFSAYAKIKQPKITAVSIAMDIFPADQSFKAEGKYTIQNTLEKDVDTLLIRTGYDEISSFHLDMPYTIIKQDTINHFSVVKLDNSLSVNDSLILYFSIKNIPNTLFETNSSVGKATTFIRADAFPKLGYPTINRELPLPENQEALNYNYTSPDADLIDFETTVSTSIDQTAVATGSLKRQWTKNNRNYYHYKMDKKVKWAFGFASSQYQLTEDRWRDVDIRVYHHKNHHYNIESMISGVKDALEYGSQNFGDYQYKEVHIVEFPITMGSYATVFGNTLPFSEVRFLADTSGDNFDLPYYVAAHEMGHQWWANQVIPAATLGSDMTTESPAEYMAAKIYEKNISKEALTSYLDAYHKKYIRVQKRLKKEKPLVYTDGARKIAYIKGSLALYSLSQQIGEETLNDALRAYVEKVKYQTKPYTTSLEMLAYLKQGTPDSLQYLITDNFETVTYYEHSIETVSQKEKSNSQYEVSIDFNTKKMRKDSNGNGDPQRLPLADYIQIVVFGEHKNILYKRMHKIVSESNRLTVTVDRKPLEVAIDPFHLGFNTNAEKARVEIR